MADEGAKKPVFVDIAGLEEDKRIEMIGHTVMAHRKTVAVTTDDEPGKADRYVKKLIARFPGIRIMERFPGPVAGVVCFKVGPPNKSRK